MDQNLEGRNLASEAISSDKYEKKKTMFQKYVFDSYKHQHFFQTTTEEIQDKITDALWPFYPENMPKEIVTEYDAFCKKMR